MVAIPTAARAAPPSESAVPEAELIPPEVTVGVQPYTYPEALLDHEAPPSGEVLVEYVVGTDGVPKEIEVLERLDPLLDAIAVDVVAALRFRPATYAGEPIEVVLSIAIPFTAPEPEPPDGGDGGEVEGGAGGEGDAGSGGEVEVEDVPGVLRISGVLIEAGRGSPVGGGTVLAVPAGDYPEGKVRHKLYGDEDEPAWILKTLTDDEGEFELRDVPDGLVRLIMIAPNFERLEWVVKLERGKQLETKYFLTRTSANPFRTEVTVEREKMPEVVSREITIEEVNEIPGTQGDALKSIQNFPGVARSAFGTGQLAIRGAAPEDSGVYLGYHEIPTLFHFGGLSSVFNSDILAQIDFIPGNFDSRYGDAMGGIINVQPRKGRLDGFHGYVDTDLFDTGVLVEGPLGKPGKAKGSFILSARRSYVDLLLPLIIPDEVGLGLTLAPRYWDYQALFDHQVGGGELSVRVFGSDDRARLLFTEQNDVTEDERNALETIQWFHRVDLVYRRVDGPWEFLVTPSYKREYFSGKIFGQFDFEVDTDTLSARAEISRRLSKSARLRVGTELVSEWWRGRAVIQPFGDNAAGAGSGDAIVRETPYTRVIPSLYTTLTWRVAKQLMLLPGLRFDWFVPNNRAAVDPRLRFVLDVTDKTALKGGVGLYTQGPGEFQNDPVFGNQRIQLQRSLHTSLSVVQRIPWGVTVELTGFYKRLWDLTSTSLEIVRWPDEADAAPENFASTGTGNIYGGEVLIKKALGDRFYGWVSYTLMRSVRRPAPGEEQQLFDFDQTHILTLIASYDFPMNWRIGARFRLISGNPYTPVVNGVFNATSGTGYIPIYGPPNSARLPTFHQLDLRVDKTWVYKRIKVTSYLDVQNVYNAENTEFLSYSYDYQVTRPVLSLPTAPSIGLKLEW